MLKVNFESISIQNFLSVGETPVEIKFRPGINIITGQNFDKVDRANGVGKSTIADAIFFGIFGSTMRDTNTEDIPNNVTQGRCLVVIKFHTIDNGTVVNYRIERSLNPSKCSFFKEDENVTKSGILQTNEYICKTVHSSPELFLNGVCMSLNDTVPFMKQKKADKRKFIEGILNLGYFSEMLVIARNDFNEAKKTFDIESAKIAEMERTIKILRNQKDLFEADKQKKLEENTKQYQKYETELTLLTNRLSPYDTAKQDTLFNNIKKLKDAHKKYSDNLVVTRSQKYQKDADVKAALAKIVDLNKKKGICQFCQKNVDELLCDQNQKARIEAEESIKIGQQESKVIEEKINADVAMIERVAQGINNFEAQLMVLKLQLKEEENIKNNITQINKWMKLIKEEEEKIRQSTNTSDNELVDLESRFLKTQTTVVELKAKLEIIESAKFIVSEEGVKSLLIKKILKILNSKLSYYLQKMEANCSVVFNEYFEEKILNEKGLSCSYGNFSGAEKKAIDFACMFTFIDIRRLQGDVAINISIYDEFLDSSLDEKGIDLTLDILKDRVDKYQESVYIISHRRESVKHVTGEVIFIEKHSGISQRVPYLTP